MIVDWIAKKRVGRKACRCGFHNDVHIPAVQWKRCFHFNCHRGYVLSFCSDYRFDRIIRIVHRDQLAAAQRGLDIVVSRQFTSTQCADINANK